MSDCLTLIPASDEPSNAGRAIPLPQNGRRAGGSAAAALLARRGLSGMSHKGMGGISGSVPDLVSLLAPAGVVGSLTTVAVAWIKARAGRKVRLRIGDVEAEAQTVEEVRKLIDLAKNVPRRLE